MTSIERRIENLEHEQGGSACPSCGHRKGEKAKEINFLVSKPGEKTENSVPEKCPYCGYQHVTFVIGKGYQ